MTEIQNEFFKMHRENKSIFILAWRIIALEIGFSILGYIVSLIYIESGNSGTFSYLFWIIFALNISLGMGLLINWLYNYYIITQDDVSINTGFLFRRARTFDFRSIKSIKVKQNLIGQIFNYGTVELEIPGIPKNPFLSSVPNPFDYGKVLEEQRLKYLEREPKHDEVIPAVET